MSTRVFLFSALAFSALLGGCDDDSHVLVCTGSRCVCRERSDCEVRCPGGGCDVGCGRADLCNTLCDAECEVACSDVAQCATACGDGCQLSCIRADQCELTCEAGCDARCSDVSRCEVSVGPDSQVECTRLGNCDVTCQGTCDVSCSGVGGCDVTCAPGFVRCDAGGSVRCATECP